MNIESLLYDVVMRVPKLQIINCEDYYYLLDGDKKIALEKTIIQHLIDLKYATLNKHGGVEITEEGVSIGQAVELETIKVESKKEKGHFFKAHISPKKCYET